MTQGDGRDDYARCDDTGRHSAHEWAGGTRWCEGQMSMLPEIDREAGELREPQQAEWAGLADGRGF